MYQIDQVLISDEAWNLRFACNLKACLGNCCKIGDLGSPLDPSEAETIQHLLPKVAPLLPRQHVRFLEAGISELYKGKLHIREIESNHPCPLSFTSPDGVIYCSLHHFALDNNIPCGKVKPLWCLLFPLIITKTADHWIINVSLAPHCRSKGNPPPVLLSFADVLSDLFGEAWIKKVKQQLGSSSSE